MDMDMNLLSPYVRVAWDSVIEPPFMITERVIYDYELLYVKEGEIVVTVEDRSYRGIPGDLFLFKPKQPHSIRLAGDQPLRQPHIHFDLFYQPDSPEVKVSFKPLAAMTESERMHFREDISPHLAFPLPNHIRLHQPIIIENLIFDIIREREQQFPYHDIAVKGLFVQLWTQLLREIHWQFHAHLVSKREQLDRVRQFLSHHTGQEVTLDELAALANLSKYYLCRLFKQAYGMSPIQYHLSVRLEKAKQMIQWTDLPLSQIAESLGFQSIYAFSRAFRKLERVPPSYYRKRAQSLE